MAPLEIPGLPIAARWLVPPVAAESAAGGHVVIEAGPGTDWFVDPRGGREKRDAPLVLWDVDEGDFVLSARVEVGFVATFDAGVLMVYVDPNRWAKLCFEFSPQRRPMVVSVVTQGYSDDCNAATIPGRAIHLRIARIGQAFAFHYSHDAEHWVLVRHFTFGPDARPRIGLSAQSPTGDGSRAVFSEIEYDRRRIEDIRSGA